MAAQTPSGYILRRRALVADLHATGAHAEAIAEALEVSARTVRRDLVAQGLTPHPQGRPRRARSTSVDGVRPETMSAAEELDAAIAQLNELGLELDEE